MSIFSLNEVVSLQIENVSNNNFSSWTEEPTKGYHLGGSKKESPDGTTNLCQTFSCEFCNFTFEISLILCNYCPNFRNFRIFSRNSNNFYGNITI